MAQRLKIIRFLKAEIRANRAVFCRSEIAIGLGTNKETFYVEFAQIDEAIEQIKAKNFDQYAFIIKKGNFLYIEVRTDRKEATIL